MGKKLFSVQIIKQKDSVLFLLPLGNRKSVPHFLLFSEVRLVFFVLPGEKLGHVEDCRQVILSIDILYFHVLFRKPRVSSFSQRKKIRARGSLCPTGQFPVCGSL